MHIFIFTHLCNRSIRKGGIKTKKQQQQQKGKREKGKKGKHVT